MYLKDNRLKSVLKMQINRINVEPIKIVEDWVLAILMKLIRKGALIAKVKYMAMSMVKSNSWICQGFCNMFDVKLLKSTRIIL